MRLGPIITCVIASTTLLACGGGGSGSTPNNQGGAPTNSVPVAVDVSEKTNVNEVLTAMLNGQDSNGDPLTYSITSLPTLGGVDLTDPATGAFRYTPTVDEFGTDLFRYRVNDGTDNSSEGVVTVVINRLPEAQTHTMRVATNQPKSSNLPGSDADGDPMTFEIVSQPTNGNITDLAINTGAFTYQANTAFEGNDSFTYKLSDGFAESSVATVNLTVDEWPGTVNLGTAGDDVLIYGVEVDDQRNTYIAYAISGAVPGGTSAGGVDVALAKIDRAGTVLWQKQWGYAGDENPYQLVLGPNNLLYLTVVSYLSSTGPPEANYVLQFDLDGNLNWEINVPDPDIYNLLYRMAVAPSGNAYVTMRGGGRAGLLKINENGTLGWLKHVGSTVENPVDPLHTGQYDYYNLVIRGIAVDANELIYTFLNAFYMPTATGVEVQSTLLATFDSTGAIQSRIEPLQFSLFPQGFSQPGMGDLKLTDSGNVRMTGWQLGDQEIGLSVAEFDAAGNEIWTSVVAEAGVTRFGFRAALMADGSTIATGRIEPESATTEEEWDVHVTRLDDSGSLVWEQILDGTPGTGTPLASDVGGQPIVDTNGDVMMAVSSSGSYGSQSNQGGTDIFVMKIDGDTGEIIESN